MSLVISGRVVNSVSVTPLYLKAEVLTQRFVKLLLLLLDFNFIALWLEKIVVCIKHLEALRLLLRCNTLSMFVNIICVLGKNVSFLPVGYRILYIVA